MVFSAGAACIAEIATLPICTVKTNYQNTSMSIESVVKNLYVQGGVKEFYRGCCTAVVTQMVSTSTKYAFYRWLCDKNNLPRVLNGTISGIMSSVITHPFDVMKVHWQMKTPLLPILRDRGLPILYSGYSMSFAKVCVGSSLFLPLYDYIRAYIPNPAVASGITAIISTTIMQPIDFQKTRQTHLQSGWFGWNPLAYYRGLSLNLLRVVPHYMIVMTLIDYSDAMFSKNYKLS